MWQWRATGWMEVVLTVSKDQWLLFVSASIPAFLFFSVPISQRKTQMLNAFSPVCQLLTKEARAAPTTLVVSLSSCPACKLCLCCSLIHSSSQTHPAAGVSFTMRWNTGDKILISLVSDGHLHLQAQRCALESRPGDPEAIHECNLREDSCPWKMGEPMWIGMPEIDLPKEIRHDVVRSCPTRDDVMSEQAMFFKMMWWGAPSLADPMLCGYPLHQMCLCYYVDLFPVIIKPSLGPELYPLHLAFEDYAIASIFCRRHDQLVACFLELSSVILLPAKCQHP